MLKIESGKPNQVPKNDEIKPEQKITGKNEKQQDETVTVDAAADTKVYANGLQVVTPKLDQIL